MRRLKDGILQEYLKYSSCTEIPSVFSLWCGVSCVAASLGRDVFIPMGHYTIYPNLYVILVAGSAKCKKSTAINIAESFIKRVQPPIKIFSQKATPEALIGALCEVKEASESQIRGSAEGVIVVDELSTLIDKNAFQSGMIAFLTTLWDSRDSFSYETKKRGKESVYNSCVSLLGGTTISWIRESIPLAAIGGGFTSRVVFVYRDDYEKQLLWTVMTDENKKRNENILHDLNEVSKMRGAFAVTDQTKKFSEELYEEFVTTHSFLNNKFLEGYAGRRFTILLKLAMIVSASMNDSRLIDVKDLNVALNILKNAEVLMPKVLDAIAMQDSGVANQDVLTIIQAQKMISRKQLISLVHHKLQAQDLDIILETLSQAGKIETIIPKAGGLHYKALEFEKKFESFTDTILDGKGEKK